MHIHLSHGPESNSLGNYTFFQKLMMDKSVFFSQIWSHLDSNTCINKFTDDCREIISRLFAALSRIGHAVLVDCIKSSVWFMVKRCRLIAWVLIEILFGRCSMSQIMFASLLSKDEERNHIFSSSACITVTTTLEIFRFPSSEISEQMEFDWILSKRKNISFLFN